MPALSSSLVAIGWLSWWSQIILTTTSSVLFLFARTVATTTTISTILGSSLSCAGLCCAIVSTFWTLRYRFLANGLIGVSASEAARSAKGIAAFGRKVNIVGMALCILSAFAITGTLAAKALTSSQAAVLGVAACPVQAIDILIVQGNTNALASHFLGLLGCLRVSRRAEICEAAAAA